MQSKLYTPELAAAICTRLAAGESLRAICRDEDMPAESTVRAWALDDLEGFAAQYARARDIGLDAIADLAREVAATPVEAEKTVSKATGLEVTTGDAVDRSRLHVDTLKWYLSKLAPKRYGDKLDIEHSGSIDVATRIIAARKRTGG